MAFGFPCAESCAGSDGHVACSCVQIGASGSNAGNDAHQHQATLGPSADAAAPNLAIQDHCSEAVTCTQAMIQPAVVPWESWVRVLT